MKLLLLSILLFISTSFSSNKPIEDKWIGTFQVFENENSEFVIYYSGNYPECFTKYVIDELFVNCDSINNAIKIDSLIEINNIREIQPESIKKTRM